MSDAELPDRAATFVSLQPDAERALLARCSKVDTSAWSDALDFFGLAGVIDGLSWRSGRGRMAARAVPARHVSGALGRFEAREFAVSRLLDAVGPGRVLVVDVGGQLISTFGGLAAFAAVRAQAAGFVIDGGCRDLEEIRATGLWLASRHVTPRTGRGRLQLQPLGQSVSIGGVTVNAGDLVVGDDTGLVVIPAGHLDVVLDRAEHIMATDAGTEARLRGGASFADAAKPPARVDPA